MRLIFNAAISGRSLDQSDGNSGDVSHAPFIIRWHSTRGHRRVRMFVTSVRQSRGFELLMKQTRVLLV